MVFLNSQNNIYVGYSDFLLLENTQDENYEAKISLKNELKTCIKI